MAAGGSISPAADAAHVNRGSPLRGLRFRLTEARLRTLRPVPLLRPFRDATLGPFRTVSLTTVTLRDEDGAEGEAPITHVSSLEDLVLPRLFATPAETYEGLMDWLYWGIRNAGFRGPAAGAVGAVDLALHDLAARRAGQPLHRFLGANRDWAGAYASGGSVDLTTTELVEETVSYARAGYRCIKIKVGPYAGRQPEDDAVRVRQVRDAIGPGIELAVDANQGWNVNQAVQFGRAAAECRLAWLEEPVHSADLIALRELCPEVPFPVACGEAEACVHVYPLLREAGVRHLQANYHHFPGLEEFFRARHCAETGGLAFSSGAQSYYASQLIATGRPSDLTEFLLPITGVMAPFLAVKPEVKNARFELPDTPGIAMQPDWKACGRAGLISADRVRIPADYPASRSGGI